MHEMLCIIVFIFMCMHEGLNKNISISTCMHEKSDKYVSIFMCMHGIINQIPEKPLQTRDLSKPFRVDTSENKLGLTPAR
ncbi:hypothetical protein BHU16_06175 [Tannerella sp. oral taxon 808]|nr:hypothetical protein BHU16_06175 [Tannerella sp. oral taxon 808]